MINFYKRTLRIGAIGLLTLTTSMSSYAIQTQIDETSINTNGAVIDDYVFYNISGGRAVSMSKHNNMQSIKIGAGWNSNLICGEMSLETTLQNQLNGVTNGFQQIMGDVLLVGFLNVAKSLKKIFAYPLPEVTFQYASQTRFYFQ